MKDLIWFLLIGLIAGWLGSRIMKSGEKSLLAYLIMGVVGAVLGGFVFGLVGLSSYGLLGSLVVSTAGAVLLIWIVGQIGRK